MDKKTKKASQMKQFLLFLILFMSKICMAQVNIMAPLDIESHDQWNNFQNRLQSLKANGVSAISTDVWWGKVENEQQGQFNWKYYDRLSSLIEDAGLKWVPIMSFHQCGGNVGDTCDIPPPKWIWSYAQGKSISSYFSGSEYKVTDFNDIKYVSELGNQNMEYPSVWSTPLMAELYINFVKSFIQRYKNKSQLIEELNISLGPAGELRYPAYNSHDQNYSQSPAMFPRRGSFQGHSTLAHKSYQDYLQLKYSNSITNYNLINESQYLSFKDIYPLSHHELNQIAGGDPSFSKRVYDVFEWYHQSLIHHGRTILEGINDIKKDGPMAKIPLGVKIPGIHWNMGEDFGLGNGLSWSHRLTEANAGLINPRDKLIHETNNGVGYRKLLIGLKSIENNISSPIIIHFTCLEMGNNENTHLGASSMAKSLVHWFGKESKRNGLTIKGENALEGSLYSKHSWDNIQDALNFAGYEGLTILRMGNLTDNPNVMNEIRNISSHFNDTHKD